LCLASLRYPAAGVKIETDENEASGATADATAWHEGVKTRVFKPANGQRLVIGVVGALPRDFGPRGSMPNTASPPLDGACPLPYEAARWLTPVAATRKTGSAT